MTVFDLWNNIWNRAYVQWWRRGLNRDTEIILVNEWIPTCVFRTFISRRVVHNEVCLLLSWELLIELIISEGFYSERIMGYMYAVRVVTSSSGLGQLPRQNFHSACLPFLKPKHRNDRLWSRMVLILHLWRQAFEPLGRSAGSPSIRGPQAHETSSGVEIGRAHCRSTLRRRLPWYLPPLTWHSVVLSEVWRNLGLKRSCSYSNEL